MSPRSLILMAAFTTAVVPPAWAHHSNVMYDSQTTTRVDGTVRELRLANPHSWLYVTVTDENGETTDWALESSAAASLLRRGWTREAFEPGTVVSVTFHPMRDGTLAGELESVTLENGQTLD